MTCDRPLPWPWLKAPLSTVRCVSATSLRPNLLLLFWKKFFKERVDAVAVDGREGVITALSLNADLAPTLVTELTLGTCDNVEVDNCLVIGANRPTCDCELKVV